MSATAGRIGATNTGALPRVSRINGTGELTIVQPDPRSVYHYTSAAGLLGILRDGYLWLTHVEHLNDRSEGAQGLLVAERTLEILAPRVHAPVTKLDEARNAYVLSASSAPDLLNQWQHYGNNGFAIAFSRTGTPWTLNGAVDHFDVGTWRDIDYIDGTADAVDALAQRWAEELASELAHLEPAEAKRYLVARLAARAFTVKDSAFSAEQESRIVVVEDPDMNRIGEDVRLSPTGELVRHVSLTVGPNAALPIGHIVCGPGDIGQQERAAAGVWRLCERAGLSDLPLYKSAIPLVARR